ncbi:hypothetical protein [Polynucleobacter sp.]|uniref:hypothetical protein n=1 Tax=Polynucleobacter sp. TaxID=2029855 RepID=UPI003F6A0C88
MNLQDFVIKNLWGIIAFSVGMVVFYTTTNIRLSGIEAKAVEAKAEASSLRSLVERIIVLEEKDKQVVEDLQEIKEELRIIKSLVR